MIRQNPETLKNLESVISGLNIEDINVGSCERAEQFTRAQGRGTPLIGRSARAQRLDLPLSRFAVSVSPVSDDAFYPPRTVPEPARRQPTLV